eukprot:m.184855 g.184855  ORF g.184855 m.184855 type:complete len:51 (-) comp14721_c1_seq3:254-406(-)
MPTTTITSTSLIVSVWLLEVVQNEEDDTSQLIHPKSRTRTDMVNSLINMR